MMSISLLVIAGILLVITFYVSQQTRSNEERPRLTVTPEVDSSSITDLPTCAGLDSLEEELTCYAEAVQVSEALVLSLVDDLFMKEPETARRVAFMETQIAWEEARDADCAFVRDMADDEGEGLLQELTCLTEHNLARLERLERYRCEWYQTDDCQAGDSTGD